MRRNTKLSESASCVFRQRYRQPELLTAALQPPTNAQAMRAVLGQRYPVTGLAWLKKNPPKGRIFSTLEWGGYLNYQDPATPVFMDGRMDLFEHSGVFADYLKAISLDGSLEVLDRYRIESVLLPNGTPLVYLLEHTPEWTVAYRDGNAVVLVRVH